MKKLQWISMVLAVVLLSGCGMMMGGYSAKDMNEWVAQSEAINANGCVYMRGNARPYADVSMMYIAAYGKNAPQYLECLEAIPPEARFINPSRQLP